jgi:hypothetical protein
MKDKVRGPFEWTAMKETYVQNQRQVSPTRYVTSRSLQVSDIRFYFLCFICKYLNIQCVLL